jgi:hypothetical protein
LKKDSHVSPFLLVYAAAALAVIYVLTAGGLGVSYDSGNYLLSAQLLAAGEWGRAAAPIWPPLYPLAIALLDVPGSVHPLKAARILSVLTYAALVVAIFLWGLWAHGKLTAHLCAVSALCLAPLIYVYCFCWSETLYTTLSVLFFLVLTLSFESSGKRQAKYLICAAIFAGLASVTRFIGLSLIGTGALSILFFTGHHTWSGKLKKTLTFLLVSCAPILLYFLIRLLHYGLVAKTQHPPRYSFWYQLLQLFSTIYHDFLSFGLSFWKYVFFFEWSFLSFWLRIPPLAGILLLLLLLGRTMLSPGSASGFSSTHKAVLLYAALYGSILIYVSATMAVDPVGSRFTVPLYPPMLLLLFSAVSNGYQTLVEKRAGKPALLLLVLCLTSFWGIQVLSCCSIHKGVSAGKFPAMEHPGNVNRESLKFLKQDADSGDLIVTNVPRKLSFIWPRSVPYPYIPKIGWDPAQKELTYEASRRSVYVLICTQDFSPGGIDSEDIEEADRQTGLFYWKKIFQDDLVAKVKPVAIQAPRKSREGQ